RSLAFNHLPQPQCLVIRQLCERKEPSAVLAERKLPSMPVVAYPSGRSARPDLFGRPVLAPAHLLSVDLTQYLGEGLGGPVGDVGRFPAPSLSGHWWST